MPAVIALLLAFAAAPAAQMENLSGVVGLLPLIELLPAVPCEEPPRREIPLYAEPDSGAPIASIRAGRHPLSENDCYSIIFNVHSTADGSVRELPTGEYEEEEPDAAIVLERRGDWFKVRLSDGAAWVRVAKDHPYFSFAELLHMRPAFLTQSWDGTLAETPGGPTHRPPSDPRRRVIGYVEPEFEQIRVVLQPGQDPEELRKQYEASSMGSSPGPNGTRIVRLERGTWVEAFEEPDRRATVLGRFRTDKCWGSVRSDSSNPPNVPVFDRHPGWLQVALEGNNWRDDRRAWIEHTPVWRFRAFSDDGERLEFEEDVFGREHSSVSVVATKEIRGTLWHQIQVMSHTIYDSDETPRVIATGWVPAHDAAGEPIVWFHSRD